MYAFAGTLPVVLNLAFDFDSESAVLAVYYFAVVGFFVLLLEHLHHYLLEYLCYSF